MARLAAALLIGLALARADAPAAAQDEQLPLPRFVSLKADEVNMRAGPGESYPVEWVFTRKGLPVEVIAQYEHWRKIRDIDGTVGWVHQVMLSGQRTVLVNGAGVHTALEEPSLGADPAFRAEAGVQGSLLFCEPGWCRIEVAGVKGWLPMRELWGVYPKDGAGG